jgi:hypothetical protein
MGMKWADLLKRSTMTHIELYPREVWGKPTMKSMQMFSYFHSGMLKGCRFLVGLKWSALILRHVSHSDTYFAISCFILVHQKFFFKSWYILLVPGWIEYHEQLTSFMILQWSSKSFGTTRRSLNYRTSSASYRKHWASSNSNFRRRWPIPTSVLWRGNDIFFDSWNESYVVQSAMRNNLETWFFGITTWRVRLNCEMVVSMLAA